MNCICHRFLVDSSNNTHDASWVVTNSAWRRVAMGASHNTIDTLDACQKHASRAGTSNYIPQILWDVITCPCPWYLLLPHTSSYIDLNFYTIQRRQNPPQIILKIHKSIAISKLYITWYLKLTTGWSYLTVIGYRRFVRYWDYCETYWTHRCGIEFNIPFVVEILCRDDIVTIIWKIYQCPESQCYANVRKFKVQKASILNKDFSS